jgi:hypothetical protein
MANEQNLQPFNSETAVAAGQKGGTNKKGSKHMSTWIQELLNDPEFEANVLDPKKGYIEYKGAPMKAIIQVQLLKAVNGDQKAFDLLGKYGYGIKTEVEHTGAVATGEFKEELATEFAEFMKKKTKS